jgi:phosphoenolpyruvate-protein phosphotransferase (PTS system enzyme I)
MLTRSKEKRIWGIGAAAGIVEGRAHVLNRRKAKFGKKYIQEDQVPREIKRVEKAIGKARADLLKIKKETANEEVQEHVYILDSHLMILEDPMLLESVREIISSEKKNAEWALFSAFDNVKKVFDAIDNEYFKERKSDFDYLNSWVLRHLSGNQEESLAQIKEKVIVISHYLSPADAAQMDRRKVIGFVTDIGGKTSHTAILARALKIPAVVGAERATQEINSGNRVILDGREGLVIVNPTRESTKQYRARGLQYGNLEKILLKERDLPAETVDGRRVILSANMEMVEEAQSALAYGAEGIGLYRTEFLCLSQARIPSEEELFRVYKDVVQRLAPRPVNLRTFDFGSDKSPDIHPLEREANPALGLRSIRYCLKESEVFKDQLRAILRASHYGKAQIMFPMISGVSELRRARLLFDEAREELIRKGEPFDQNLKIGIMIEVPSAALIADLLAREADFFSIGTNDLIQYALAIDRVNKEVAYLYEPLHPSILRLLKSVVDAGHSAGIPVGMCGEMASDLRYIFILLGFGFDQLSMVSFMVPWIRKIIRSSRYRETEDLVREMLQGRESRENEETLSTWIREKGPHIPEMVLG